VKITGLSHTEVDELVDVFSTLMRQEMRKCCRLAADDVTASFSTVVADGELFSAMDSISIIPDTWRQGVLATLLPFLEKIFSLSAAKVATPLGDVTPVKMTNYLADMQNVVMSFSSDMWDAAKASLIVGAQDGESIAQLAARVEAVATVKAKKAHVIAQTTVIAAVNGGEWKQMMESASALDLAMTKEWVSTHDVRTRLTHEQADGQTVPLNEKFQVGDTLLDFPGDPNGDPSEIISCRCTTVYDAEVDDQITASTTSPETLSDVSAAVVLEPETALVAAFNEKDHPRGKDGKFIKSSLVGGWVKSILAGKYKLHDMVTSEKKSFVHDAATLDKGTWDNLKNEQKKRLTVALDDAVDDGIPGAAKAVVHLEELDDENSDHVPDLFNPSTPLPATSKPMENIASEMVSESTAKKLQKLPSAGNDDQKAAIKEALEGHESFGDHATVFATVKDGEVKGALSLIDHTDADEDEGGPFQLIDYVGASGSGVGTSLVKKAMTHAVAKQQPLLLEPTPTSKPYWDKLGAVEDPLDTGVAYFGFSVPQMKKILSGIPPHLEGYDEAAQITKKNLDEYHQDGALTDAEYAGFQKKLWNAKSTHDVNEVHHDMDVVATKWYNEHDDANDDGDENVITQDEDDDDDTPTVPSHVPITTGSNTPIKVTHGLIHAKHAPGTVIAQTGTGVKVTWNGSSYDISNASGGGEKGVKKSKLYALLNDKYKMASWNAPGKQQTEVSHTTPLSAAPTPNPIPHPVSMGSAPSIVGPHASPLAPIATPTKPSPFQILEDTGDSGDDYAAPGLWGKYGAAGVLIKNTDANGVERFLMVQRGPMVSSNKWKWQLAGGALDSKETPEQGAAREIFEEIGAPQDFLSTMQHKGTHAVEVPIPGKKPWVYSNIAAEAPTMFEPKIDGTETGDAKWMTKAEIQALVDEGKMHPAVSKALPSVFSLFDTEDNNETSSPNVTPDVTPSAPVVQSPSTPSVGQVHDMSTWKKVGGQTGSNQGAMYEDEAGQKYYVKSLKSEDHAKSEVLAAALYRATGMDVPEVRHGSNHPEGWSNIVVSPIVPNAKTAKAKLGGSNAGFVADVQSGYAVDAWLANHDVVGMDYDNIIDSNGKPWRIDMGGSLAYRAQGGKKTGWGPDPTAELNGLKNPGVNTTSAKVFKTMTTAEERESAKKLLPLTDTKIDQLVKDAGMPSSLGDTLKARRNAILAKYGLDSSTTPVTTNAPVSTVTPASTVTPPSVPSTSSAPTYSTDHFSTLGIDISHVPDVPGGLIAKGKTSKFPNADYAYAFNETGNLAFMYKTPGNTWKPMAGSYTQSKANASKLGIEWTLTTDSEAIDLDLDAPSAFTVPPVTATPSVNTPSVTLTADDVPSVVQGAFYTYFKDEKVSPAWSGSKIYHSMHAAKAKMSGDPKIAALSDAELLKVLDKQHSIAKATDSSLKPYGDKVRAWLKTPNGQKAFQQLNPAIASGPSSSSSSSSSLNAPSTGYTPWKAAPAKKMVGKKTAKKAASSLTIEKTPDEILAHMPGGSSGLSPSTEDLYALVKAKPTGNSVKHAPVELFKSINDVATKKGVSVNDVLTAMDVETAKKYSSVTHTYKQTISDWLHTSKGNTDANAIMNGTYVAPVKKVAKKSFGGGSTAGPEKYAANLPLSQKVVKKDQNVPAWDPSTPSSDFPVISTSEAATLWDDMQATHGQMKSTEKSALHYYTTNSGFSAMNGYLRGKKGASEALQKKVNDAQDGMKPTTKSIFLHRGTDFFTSSSTGQEWTSYANIKALEGTTFHNESFFSASVGGSSAFGGPLKFEIECPVGTPMAYVKAFSQYGGENEMLLAADLNYKIISVTESGSGSYGKKTVVRLRVMAPEGVA
jgi:8-oxo-dGTP pyrophosphatase MutT (NUDIX family)